MIHSYFYHLGILDKKDLKDQKPFFVNQEYFLYSFYEPPWLDLCKSDDFMSIDLVIFRDMKMPQTNHSSHIVHWYMVEHSGACCEHTDRLKISLSLSFAKKVLIYLYFFVRNRSHMKPFHILKISRYSTSKCVENNHSKLETSGKIKKDTSVELLSSSHPIFLFQVSFLVFVKEK